MLLAQRRMHVTHSTASTTTATASRRRPRTQPVPRPQETQPSVYGDWKIECITLIQTCEQGVNQTKRCT